MLKDKHKIEQLSHEYDSYIKTVLRNFRTDYIRRNKNKWKNECFLEELPFNKKENILKTHDKNKDKNIYLIDNKMITSDMIHEAINKLPNTKSIVINLHYFDDYTDTRIAKILGITQEGISKRRRTALKLLKELLKGFGDEQET